MYRTSIGITTSMSVSATHWIGDNAENFEVDGIWVGEDIGVGQDATVLTTDLLMRTSNIKVGTGILPISTHNISTIARGALTLQEIGKGRFCLGIGLGGIQDLQKQGIKIEKPVTALRDATNILRRLFASESVTIESALFNLQSFSLNLSAPIDIPIVFGVRGPQMLTLASKLADGVILSGPIKYIEDAIGLIESTTAKTGHRGQSVEKIVWLPTIPTFKGGSDNLAKRVVALVIADTPRQVLETLNVDFERAEKICQAVAAGGPEAGAGLVNQEFIDTFSISGTKEYMVDRFDLLHKLGATEVVLGPPFSGDWRGAMREIFEEIMSRREN